MADGSGRSHEVLHDGNDPGCMHNFLRFIDLHQRLRIRKTLAYRSERHKTPKKKQNVMQDIPEDATQDVSDNVSPVGGYPNDWGKDSAPVGGYPNDLRKDSAPVGGYPNDSGKDSAPVGGDPNDLGKDSAVVAKTKENSRAKASPISLMAKASPNSLMKVLVFKKRFKGKHKRQNTAADESEIMRTLSIHHLSRDDFVAPDELSIEDENFEDSFNSDESYCSSRYDVSSNSTDATEMSNRGKQHMVHRSSNTRDRVGFQDDDSITELNADSESDCSSRNKSMPNSLKTAEVSTTGMHRQLSRNRSSMYREDEDRNGNHLEEKQSAVRKKLKEAEDSSSMQIAAVAKELGVDATLLQSKEFMEMMQLFSANRELFLKFLDDPTFILRDQAQKQEDSIPGKGLTKFGSFPRVGRSLSNDKKSLDHLQKEAESTCKGEKNLRDKNPTLVQNVNEDGAQSAESMADEDSNTLLEDKKGHKNVGVGLRHFQYLKKKIKSIIRENKTEHKRISMDSILHKIPYGEKLSQNTTNPPSAKPDKPTSKGNFWKAGISSSSCKHPFRKMMKSSSLTESLGRYSQLLESASSPEPNKSLRMSKSIKYDMDVENRMSTKSLARVFSLPERHTDSLSKYIRNDVPICQVEMQPGSGDNPTYVDDGDHGQVDLAAAYRHSNGSLESVNMVEEQSSSFNEQEKVEACKGQNLSRVEERCYCDPDGASDGHEDTPSLDTATSYDSDARTSQVHAEESSYLMSVPQTDSDSQTSLTKDDVVYDLPNLRRTQIQVNEREEAEFRYVRNILDKSGFSNQQAIAEWYLPDQPVDPLLFDEEEEYLYKEPRLVENEPMTTLKHMLLFDLINEVLLETYDASFAHCPWVLHSDHQIRPLPVGHRILEEVWSVISKHLSSQLLLDQTVEGTVARDFMKNDGWMILKHDIECVGLGFGDLILEDILDEIVIDLLIY